MRVLFVCTGNICRSPMAEAMARAMLKERGRADIVVSSAGTSASVGSPASEGAYLVGIEKGFDLSAHLASQLTEELVEDADLILAMSVHHVHRAEMLGGEGKTYLLGGYAGRDADTEEVDDPFGGDLEDYRVTHEQLDSMLKDAIERIISTERDAQSGTA